MKPRRRVRCSWKDCEAEGTESQLDRNESEWALLCVDHAKELDEAIGTLKPKPLLRAWARAGHGHQSRERFKAEAVKGAVAIGRFAQALKKGRPPNG